jgi:LCP family protein required for cell wall assembly
MNLPHARKSMYQRQSFKHLSRFQGCLVIGFVAILLMLCSCTGILALYIAIPPSPVDILVMGLDSRGDEGTITRTDSIMVVGIKPSRFDLSLLSIPRDLFIDVPNYGMERINTINVLAEMEAAGTGPALLSQSIENNFGIGIDYYVRLDFQAFVALVDSVGGLDIEVPYDLVDYDFPTPDYGTMEVRFTAGWEHMDGERALQYARTRHADDDYRRAERQQQVVVALSGKMMNPFNWPAAWIAIQSHTETNLSPLHLGLVLPAILVGSMDIEQLVVDREYILPGDGYSYPNYEALRPFIEEHFD